MVITDLDDPVSITYKDMEPIVHQVVSKHRKRYGGDYDDLLGQANLIFMRIYQDFDPSRGIFGKRVRFIIEKRLVDELRKEWKKNPSDRKEYFPLEEFPTRHKFDVGILIDRLSEDGKLAVKLALGMADEDTPDGVRQVLVECLFELGWSGQRISDVLNEVRSLLR